MSVVVVVENKGFLIPDDDNGEHHGSDDEYNIKQCRYNAVLFPQILTIDTQ